MKDVTIIPIEPTELASRCRALQQAGGRMQMAYAWRRSDGQAQVRYLAAPQRSEPFELWVCQPQGNRLPSMAEIVPMLGWYEREIQDLFDIQFDHHPEPWPLVLHEGASPQPPPLEPAAPRDQAMPFERKPWQLPHIEAEDVQRLPFGPVRADVMESAQFVFFYLGENILHYHPRLFFKHRGIEKRFEGLQPDLGAVLAERVSGVGSLTHALAYCQAVESAANGQIPPRAAHLRTLLAELERLYNHLHYLGHLADTTTLKVANAQGRLLEERAKQLNAQYTGSRLLRNLLLPGGLRRDLTDLAALSEGLRRLQPEVEQYMRRLADTPSYLDRLITTGPLSRQVAFDQGATGPIERASGLDRDLRRDHPYAAYSSITVNVCTDDRGDAFARAKVRMDEIQATFDCLYRLLHAMPQGPVRSDLHIPANSEGIGWTENPRGALYYAVHLDEAGLLKRVKIKSPSFSNWRVFPFTVHSTDMMDYAINEASFGLTIAGCDR